MYANHGDMFVITARDGALGHVGRVGLVSARFDHFLFVLRLLSGTHNEYYPWVSEIADSACA